jgi:uncharacterized membrane protein YccC
MITINLAPGANLTIQLHSDEINSKLDRLLALQTQTSEEIITMDGNVQAALDTLEQQVAQNTSVEGSAVTLITGVAQQLADLKAQLDSGAADNATIASKLGSFSGALNDGAGKLAAAVAANTPAPPAE